MNGRNAGVEGLGRVMEREGTMDGWSTTLRLVFFATKFLSNRKLGLKLAFF
jgi:hypothetical protein